MKKIVFSIFIIMLLLVNLTQISYAKEDDDKKAIEGSDFVQKAFDATSSFLNEKPKDPQGSNGSITTIFNFLKKIIKAVNRVLLVALSALSMIALSVIGIKYIMSGANAGSQKQAKEELKTVVIGMAFGYGAYAIWAVGMSIVTVIINTLSTSPTS